MTQREWDQEVVGAVMRTSANGALAAPDSGGGGGGGKKSWVLRDAWVELIRARVAWLLRA